MAARAILKGPARPRSLGCTSGPQTPPGTPFPGAQRVTAGAAGGRIPHQTPTWYPHTPLTTLPPMCEHSLPRAARARMLRAELGPPPLQLDSLQSPHLTEGEAKAVVPDGAQGQLPPGQLHLPGGISRTTPGPQGLSAAEAWIMGFPVSPACPEVTLLWQEAGSMGSRPHVSTTLPPCDPASGERTPPPRKPSASLSAHLQASLGSGPHLHSPPGPPPQACPTPPCPTSEQGLWIALCPCPP